MNNADRLVILDEIHHVPELFMELRGIIDRGRRGEGRATGRFLILGLGVPRPVAAKRKLGRAHRIRAHESAERPRNRK